MSNSTLTDERFSNLKGRKILFLGAEPMMCMVISTAKEMGLYTIATGCNPISQSPGKLVADEYWDIDYTDIDMLEKACRENRVDGVFAAFGELRIVVARELCDRLGLPYYGEREQINIVRDKYKFKSACREFGVPTVEKYELSTDLPREQMADLRYPLVVKPTDSSASKGISVVHDEAELHIAVEKALSFSAAKTILAEQYMEGPELNMGYTIQNGVISLTFMSESICGEQRDERIKVCYGQLFPCRYLQEFIDSADKRYRDMIRGIGIRNGYIFFMAFYDHGDFRAFEANYRISGAVEYYMIAYNNEINPMKMMLACSIKGKMQGWDAVKYNNAFFRHPSANLNIYARPGKIGRVNDLEKIRQIPRVLSVGQLHQIGEVIPDSGDLYQTFARVTLASDSPAELADRIQAVYQMIDLRDVEGNDMILSRMDRNLVAHYWDGTGMYN